ncbi:hypothetical protein LJK87_26400 [Paenibacillus sp. P25]|nr:hypothetical protein LJK87_26400 [Paenibacillus sp. P25]
MAETDYDVLIVGGGAGGGAVLWRLCEQWGQEGKRIGMIEAGDLLLPTHGFNVPTFDEDRAAAYVARVADPTVRRWTDYPVRHHHSGLRRKNRTMVQLCSPI